MLRLHSAVENETQLAKVNNTRVTTLMVTNLTVCPDTGSDGWGTLPATSVNLSCKTSTQSADHL